MRGVEIDTGANVRARDWEIGTCELEIDTGGTARTCDVEGGSCGAESDLGAAVRACAGNAEFNTGIAA